MLCRFNSYCNNTDIYLSKESYVSSFFEKKFLDTAIKKGHIVKAKLIKEHYINDYTQSGVVYPTDEKWVHTSIIIMEKPTEDDLWVLMNLLMRLIYIL